jgi:hypothetical protein
MVKKQFTLMLLFSDLANPGCSSFLQQQAGSLYFPQYIPSSSDMSENLNDFKDDSSKAS